MPFHLEFSLSLWTTYIEREHPQSWGWPRPTKKWGRNSGGLLLIFCDAKNGQKSAGYTLDSPLKSWLYVNASVNWTFACKLEFLVGPLTRKHKKHLQSRKMEKIGGVLSKIDDMDQKKKLWIGIACILLIIMSWYANRWAATRCGKDKVAY